MKKHFHLITLLCLFVSASAFSQRYRTAADTFKLNEEYIKVSNQITDLTAQLNTAESSLPNYKKKADNALEASQNEARRNREKANVSTGDNIKDAKRARREAKRALKEAKKSSVANKKEEGMDRKIGNLRAELRKKQDRLQELESMRSTIRSTPQ